MCRQRARPRRPRARRGPRSRSCGAAWRRSPSARRSAEGAGVGAPRTISPCGVVVLGAIAAEDTWRRCERSRHASSACAHPQAADRRRLCRRREAPRRAVRGRRRRRRRLRWRRGMPNDGDDVEPLDVVMDEEAAASAACRYARGGATWRHPHPGGYDDAEEDDGEFVGSRWRHLGAHKGRRQGPLRRRRGYRVAADRHVSAIGPRAEARGAVGRIGVQAIVALGALDRRDAVVFRACAALRDTGAASS